MHIRFLILIIFLLSGSECIHAQKPSMMFADTTRLGRPFAKDPHVISFDGRYLMYYSVPAYNEKDGTSHGWANNNRY
jgi:hypothetical protein